MKRREFITLIGGAAAAWPLSARAQQGAGRRPLIACLNPGEANSKTIAAFQDGMKELGYIEGRNYDFAVVLTGVEGLNSKLVEIARELIPDVKTIGLLVNVANLGNKLQRREIEAAAEAHAIDIVPSEIRTPDDLDGAFNLLAREHVPVFIALRDALTSAQPDRVVNLAAKARLPGVYGFREFVEAGGLISYGINLVANWHRIAALVDKILKGEQVANIPVEFPTKIELLINLKTAKALGLTLPQTLILSADEVIE